jgi:5'-3' exonuclease
VLQKLNNLYLLDASIYIFRAWFSMPDRWNTPQGMPLNAVYGYVSFLLDLLQEINAGEGVSLAAAFDESLGSCYRNEIYPAYKSSRELPDEALAFQLHSCRKVTELLDIPSYAGPTYEADDYIATLSARGRELGKPVCIVSRDKDLGQLLLGAEDRWWDYAAGSRLDSSGFIERFGVQPGQFPDYQGLVGDSVDDIPGVPGVGAKSAVQLLAAHPSLEALYENIDRVGEIKMRGAARARSALVEHREQAFMCRELARLAQNIDGIGVPDEYLLKAEAVAQLGDYLEELGLRGPLLRRCDTLRTRLEG